MQKKKNYRLYLHYKKYNKTKNIPKTNSKKKKTLKAKNIHTFWIDGDSREKLLEIAGETFEEQRGK